MRTCLATIHWHDQSSGDGMVNINGKLYALFGGYMPELPHGTKIAVNYVVGCFLDKNLNLVEYIDFCNININLTNILKGKMK